MTAQEKQQILSLRDEGKSYAEIARETGLARSTVSSFCQKNRPNNLIDCEFRGNTVANGKATEMAPQCHVTVSFAEQPNETALAEALQILMSVR